MAQDSLQMLQRQQPEIALLLNCVSARPEPARRQQIALLLRQNINWEALWRLAERNCLLPLLYVNLKTLASKQTPNYILQRLVRSYQRTAVDNLFLTHQLVDLLDHLAASDIRVIAYKGPTLAHAVYGNLALRQFGDLDLIVPTDQIAGARAVILQQGFTQTWPESSLPSRDERAHIEQKYNYTFYRAADQMVVELHWGISPRYIGVPAQAGSLWQRLQQIPLAGKPVLVFPPEELLLALCVHGANHCWNRLHWVCDVGEVIRHAPALDWSHVCQLAREWQAERMLHIGLHLAHGLLNVELPAAVHARLQADSSALQLATQSCKWLFSPQWLPFKPFEEPLYHLQMRDHWRQRLHYCRQMLVPSSADRALLPVPAPLAALLVLLRPLRLITKHGIQLVTRE